MSGQGAESPWSAACLGLIRSQTRLLANLSHEIKNGLAVMNEQAALAGEILEPGCSPEEVERGRKLMERLRARLKQTDQAVRLLNSLAHLGDKELAQVEAGQMLAVLAGAYARLASLRRLELEAVPSEKPLGAVTRPPLLMAALYAALDRACLSMEGGGVVRLEARPGQGGLVFRIIPPSPPQTLEDGPAEELLAVLGASWSGRPAEGGWEFFLPANPPEGGI